MAAITRRSRTRDTNTWPGFVDALATLLMVIIFVLMIFIIAQFYLTQLLSGRNEALSRLQRQVSELSELLALERDTSTELRINVAQLSAELQSSIAARDNLSERVSQLQNQREQLEDRLALSVSEQVALRQKLAEAESGHEGREVRIAQVLSERDKLLTKLRAIEQEARLAKAERDELNFGIQDAFKVLEANRETIRLQLRDLESLRRDIAALRDLRTNLESQIGELVAAMMLLKEKLAKEKMNVKNVQAALETSQKAQNLSENDLVEARELLRGMISKLVTERRRAADLAGAEAQREASIAELTALLGNARDTRTMLEERITKLQQTTLLSQKEITERDTRLEELTSTYDLTREQLTDEQKISAEARAQIALLNRQLLALRQQIASLQHALETSEATNASQNVKILDLGKRLNRALASKVQELARFRSEFFGRLREVLKNRRDIRVVGDRFVFQSEVLFESGSADIAAEGERELRRLAEALQEIAPKIPQTINWILQVEGHTDRVPIFNNQFRSNWALSNARALSVVRFLITEGVPPERLSATGYGEFQPIDETRDELGNRRNRRIEIKLTQK